MDALKRAEKARQAQAAKQADGKGMSASKLVLDPDDIDQPGESAPPEPPAEPEPASSPSEPPSSPAESPATTQFSLADDFPATERVPPPAAAEEEKLGPFSLVRENELSLEDTGEMLPVVREAEKSLNEYFDDPDSSAAAAPDPAATSMDEKSTVLGGPAARENDRGSKRAAQSVFNAKAPAVARYQRNRTLMIALPLLLLGAVGVGVMLFWGDLQKTFFGAPPKLMPPRPPETAQIRPPPVADTAAEAARLAAAAKAAAAAQTTAATESPAAAVEAPGDSVEAKTAVTAGASKSSSAATVAGGAEEKIAAAAPSAGETAAAVTSGNILPAQPPAFSQPLLPDLGRPYAAASASGIRISRSADLDRVHAGINEAYLAFQQGNNAAAWRLYSQVHRQHPNNRNALLGLGAIAVHNGNYAEAVRYYVRLLSIDPRDPIARAALINLNQSVSAGEGESHIKRLLAEDSGQPFLHFTLGNLYARQGRWAEAQQAYFDAYRRDSNSGDYAFNLAVSLDQLGQPAAALTYYQRALVLALQGPTSFEPRIARMRIERLTAGGQG